MSREGERSEGRLDRLEERVDQLEEAVRRLYREASSEPSDPPTQAEPETFQTTSPTRVQSEAQQGNDPEAPAASLEERIGADLLAKTGVLVLVLGLAFFIAWAIETGLIGLTARIVLGILLGMTAVAVAHPFRDSPQYGRLARVFAGGGFGLAYFCIFAAHHLPEYQAAIGMGFWSNTTLLTLVAVAVAVYGLYLSSPAFLLEALALGVTTAFLANEFTVFTLVYATAIGLGIAGGGARLRAPRVAMAALATVYGHAGFTYLAGEEPGFVLAALAIDGTLIAGFALAVPEEATLKRDPSSSGRVLLYGLNAAVFVTLGTAVGEHGGVLDGGIFPLLAGAGLLLAALPGGLRSKRLAVASLLAGLASLLLGSWLLFSTPVVVYAWVGVYVLLGVLLPVVKERAWDLTVHALGILVAVATLRSFPELDPGMQRGLVLALVAAAYAVVFVAFKASRGGGPGTMTRTAVGHVVAFAVALALLLVLELEGWRSTVALGVAGMAPLLVGFPLDWPEARWAGLGLFGFGLSKAFTIDVWSLDPGLRVLAFVGLGLALVGGAFAYARFQPGG